ncbi:hypothetical protein [Sphingomicrobium aestuariivivum]|nr:hypothetical protein [Sphingomicrobium aestuariivivum]MCJ8191365.1 hypothetical protein [Sphingomicrobium aestuariivivum]
MSKMTVNKAVWSCPRLDRVPAKHARMATNGNLCEGQYTKVGKSMNCS